MAAGGDFDLDPEALARAEAALSALSEDYHAWVQADLARLGQAVTALRKAGAAQWPAAADQVLAIAHDIKGQAGTFGYGLLTQLGAELCRLVRAAGIAEPAASVRAEALVAAMGQVIAGRMNGDGGEAGRALLARLEVQATSPSGQD